MDITKEQFIELFNKTCKGAAENASPDNLKLSGTLLSACSFEVALDKTTISLLLSKDLINKKKNLYDLTGKIIFKEFIEYKIFDISIEEFEAMTDVFMSEQIRATLNNKNKIVADLEDVLSRCYL